MDPQLLFNLRKFLVPEIVYGEGALGLAGRHAINMGAQKPFIISDPGVSESGWTAKVEQSLVEAGLPFVTFLEVSPNPKDYQVMAGAELYRQEQCDLILAVGGGSPMDLAKGVGVVANNGGHITDYEGVDEISSPVPPLIFIPTTAGTSADVSQFAIISDTSREVKIAIVSKMVIPDLALVDPATTVTMSPELTAATGMDALCHAFEAYVSTASSPLTDMAAEKAVALVAENLRGAFAQPANMYYRQNMMMASLMAGLAFSNASLGLVHAMAHSLGGLKNLPHGECNGLLLEHVVRFNAPHVDGKYQQLGRAMGLVLDEFSEGNDIEIVVEAISALRKDLQIVQTLGEMGVNRSDLAKLAQFASQDPCLATNPREAGTSEIETIYLQIY
ncbi:MAG: iron-containing alcohol dehydrogenase [Desulfobulbaceae bacterium]|nr:MAG: iron-containing alcohol dehydrogenase [Desulfobulbaceae bacterium]